MDRGTGLVTLRFILYGDFGGTRPGERLLGSLWLVIADGSSGRNGLLAAFESIRGGGGMRPDCGTRSDLLLKVGPPKVAARLSFGETIEGGDSGETVEVGDMGSGTVVADGGAAAQTWSAK